MKGPIVHEENEKDNWDEPHSDSNEQEIIQQAVKMYDSRKYSLLEILKATGLSKDSLYPHIENRN